MTRPSLSINTTDIVDGKKVFAETMKARYKQIDDFAEALTAYCEESFVSTSATAEQTMAGPINMGTKKITNMGDPAAAQDAVTKAYLESKIGTGAFDPASFAGEESITFPNGLIMKFGYVERSGTTTTLTFEVAFTALLSITLTPVDTKNLITYTPVVRSDKTDNKSVEIYTNNVDIDGFYWLAIGR